MDATDPGIRSDNEMLAQSWRHLARSYQFVESLERFLADKDHKKEALPPEMRALMEAQPPIEELRPSQPEGRQIVRRRRVKQTMSFKDRLLHNAREARAQAAGMSAGSERERLLLKARQSEAAADIDTWVSSPGAAAPRGIDELSKRSKV
jgi:hypothetical protein